MKNIYLFSEINSDMRRTLGKKIEDMFTKAPNTLGFVLMPQACDSYFANDRILDNEFIMQINSCLNSLCAAAGKGLGGGVTLSVLCDSQITMPGIQDRIAGIGLNDSVLKNMGESSEAAHRAWLTYAKFIKAYSTEVMDVISRCFTQAEESAKEASYVSELGELNTGELKELCGVFKSKFKDYLYVDFPTDGNKILLDVIISAFRSWDSPNAAVYRKMNNLPDASRLVIAVQLCDTATGRLIVASTETKPVAEAKPTVVRKDFKSGSYYIGEMLNGKMHGKGKYVWANGQTHEGDFLNGNFDGYGIRRRADGSIMYDGGWKDDKKHGHGLCKLPVVGGLKYMCFDGNWENDKKQGYFKVYYENISDGRTTSAEEIYYIDDQKAETSSVPLSSIPDWNNIKTGKYQVTEQEREARNDRIDEVVELLCHPERIADPKNRLIENACMYLAPFVKEAEKAFKAGNHVEALSIIEVLICMDFDRSNDWINDDSYSFLDFLNKILTVTGDIVDLEEPDPEDIVIPAANLVQYVYRVYGTNRLFSGLCYIWTEIGMECEADFLWFIRMRDNGNSRIRAKYYEIDEKYYGLDVDRYDMGCNCKLITEYGYY